MTSNESFSQFHWSRLLGRAVVILIVGALVFYAVEPWLPWNARARPRTIVVYGFSILGDVMNKGIFPAFQKEWQARTGQDVTLIASFAGSGTITNQIILGVPAQVGILSTELDAQRLVDARVLPFPTWRNLPHNGTVNLTPFIILTRAGNPKQLRDFADLTRPGVGVVHADPRTSGGALWGILAEYGSAQQLGSSDADAEKQLAGVWKNVVAQASSARGARTQFENGFGDALVTYEQEALYDITRKKFNGELVYPRSTIESEHTVVVIDRNIAPDERALVNGFVEFLWSAPAQKIFVEYGFRSVDDAVNGDALTAIEKPFRVADLGGWAAVKKNIIDEIWKQKIISQNTNP
ncbi:MAG: substrate-binding domain-containing protein [Chloroflexi bacterium]|nr:substrate-binding domain-containing protein [Chloroflexota bacterium]